MLTMNHAKLSAEVGRHVAADAVIKGAYWRKADNAVGGEGCFIGCLAHDNDPQKVEATYGLPAPLVSICEEIFECLPADDARAFFAEIPAAVGRDGKDLGRVHWQFLGQILRELPDVPEVPEVPDVPPVPGVPGVQAVIDRVIAGMDLQAAGEDWPDADAVRAAADADAAEATYRDAADAVDHAARSPTEAARAARAAAEATYHAADATAAAAAHAACHAAEAAAYAARAAARAVRYAAHAAAVAAYRRQRDIMLDLIRAA